MTDRLIEALGKEKVTDSPEELRRYSAAGRKPSVVLFPTSSDQIAEILKLARREQKKVLIAGNNSQRNFGAAIEAFDWCLSLNRMNHIIEHEAADLTVTVESGVTLPQLQKFLNQKKQFSPLDPIGAEHRTLGGIAATNSSGPLRLLYGTCRDLVLGLKVVLADGTIISTGGKTVKNVAGYDLSKLFIGSMGTLGAITELTFRLFPTPAQSQTLGVEFEQLDDVSSMIQSVGPSNLVISRCEYLNRMFVEKCLAKAYQAKAPHGLLFNVQGQAEMVKVTIEKLQQMVSAREVKNMVVFDKQDDVQLWDQMSSVNAVDNKFPFDFHCQVSVPKSLLGQVINQIQKYAMDASSTIALQAHAANGIINIFWDEMRNEEIGHERYRSQIESLRQMAQSCHGNLVVHGIPDVTVTSEVTVTSPELIWGKPGNEFVLMKTIKARYDPYGVFAAGRLLGGL